MCVCCCYGYYGYYLGYCCGYGDCWCCFWRGIVAHTLFTIVPNLEKYYKILKCSPTDSLDAIKKAYRKLASEYHPDKIQSKDLPEAFIIFANEKFKEISHAHEMIVKFRKKKRKFNQTLRKFFV
ncbi:DnaJ domain-containing protein [Helicobacter pylori]|nr:DnaJ domain-containing protein [Helicobacter pylori]